MLTIHHCVNPDLAFFSFLDFLRPFGFPFSHKTDVADLNAFFDLSIVFSVLALAYIFYLAKKADKEKAKQAQRQKQKA